MSQPDYGPSTLDIPDPRSADHQVKPNAKKLRVQPTREYSFGRRLAFAIDQDCLQMVAAVHRGHNVRVTNATKFYFSAGQNSAENRQSLLQSTIRDYIDLHGGRRPSISLTITGPQTALRSVLVPELKGAELNAALEYEGRRQIPFPAEDCWLDTRVTETIVSGKQRQIRALVLAATKLAVQDLLAPFEDIGLDIRYIYQTQDVLGQLLKTLPNFSDDAFFTLINIHSKSTEIAYFQGSNLEFYHVSSLGSSFLANRTDPTVFEYFAESMATEIQNSLDFYGGQFDGGLDPEILIYGDLAYTDELIDLISDRHGLRFRRFPVDDLKLKLGAEVTPDDMCVNLSAVAAAVCRERIANLLPPMVKQQAARTRADRIGAATLIVLGAILIGQWLVSTTLQAGLQERLNQLERQAENFEASTMYATYNHIKHELSANQAFLAMTEEEPSYLGLNLKELSHQVPDAVQLYNLEFRNRVPEFNYQLSGLVTGATTPPELVLAELVENLTASPFFEDVTVERHIKRRQADGTVLDFTLSMRAIT